MSLPLPIPSPPEPASRLLREQIYEQLRADILNCQIAPGAEIREGELALRFGVSKSPVRDALMHLQREGLVQTLPRQGYRVSSVSLADVDDMFHLRAALERACMERIVRHANVIFDLERRHDLERACPNRIVEIGNR